MFELSLAGLIFIATATGLVSRSKSTEEPRSEFVWPAQPQYVHPSFKPTRSDWQPQPKPSTKAYRGATAVRTKPNRHQAKRNKA